MRKESPSACIKLKDGTHPAKVVLMPGDPLRAKTIANRYLDDAVLFNDVRNMLGFTGTYRGREVSVMGSGMGMPSFTLYAYELFNFFDVEAIIRVGSCGSLRSDVRVRDVVIAMSASTNSSMPSWYPFQGALAPTASFDLLESAVASARAIGANVQVGPVFTSDFFYNPDPGIDPKTMNYGHLCVEMETAGLYLTAMNAGKRGLSILTVSDSLVTGEALSVEDRQDSFDEMMKIALETAARFQDAISGSNHIET